MEHTVNDVLRTTTENYLLSVNPNNLPSPAKIEADLLAEIEKEFDFENAINPKGRKWKPPLELDAEQVAAILVRLHGVVRIDLTYGKLSDDKGPVPAVYQKDGPNEGIYDTSELTLKSLARQYKRSMTDKEFKEIISVIHEYAGTVVPCTEKNLIAVNNGIFDFDTKQLLPFTPEKVFISKSKVNFNPNAQNITIHNSDDGTDWDVESWMRELNDDPEVVQLLWEILSAVVRPNVPWNKAALFYSETGNNGKGTLCGLMRNLCGEGSYASLKISDFGRDFMLTELIGKSAVVTDENDVGTYIDKAADFKCAVTGDVITVNVKFKDPVKIRFRGLVVQCLNEMPRVKDKSDAFWRRQLLIPFTKCFTGAERKYIKEDYLKRQEVLEYVLYRVLHMGHCELSEPEACKMALDEYKEYNDPVRQFVEEIVPQLQWDLVPYKFLYDLYKAWYRANCPSGIVSGKINFMKEFRALMKDNSDWECDDSSHRTGNKMCVPEALIDEYCLEKWMNPMYLSSKDINKRCLPLLKSHYNGMVRVHTGGTAENA